MLLPLLIDAASTSLRDSPLLCNLIQPFGQVKPYRAPSSQPATCFCSCQSSNVTPLPGHWMVNALSATVKINHAGGQIPSTATSQLAWPGRWIPQCLCLLWPTSPFHHLPAESLGYLTHHRCGDAVPAHTHLFCPGSKLTLHFRYRSGLQWFPQPSFHLFLTETDKYQEHLPSDHLQHAGNSSPMFLCGMGVSVQTGPVVWEDCWLKSPWGSSIDIHPSFPSLFHRRGEFGGKHFSYLAWPFGVLKGDNEA